ncbi:hypothetical protein [Deinococcus hopiensis]|uniref:Uncharacterized protein n=1 Tax=Deinococcus hopiensis KR-140 TaxID=695939 RepID=A0A1W1ULR6_9DEIO|nr:hypothetical protein [Deinococcus hopiensis]SMB81939.1 hypothetical protein SAMN00790413_04777 [Deinococcus hopiensis KR-140]
MGNSLETGVIPAGVNACTKGTFNGIVTAGSTQQCSLTLDGSGTMTFTSPALTQTITLAPQTNVYYSHEKTNGVSTVAYTLENNRYASSGRRRISFAFYGPLQSPMPNVYISAEADNQEASCYARIN